MNQELARRRPANEIELYRVEPVRLVALARPIPRPTGLRRVMSPADWPIHVVVLVHLALAGAVVLPLIWWAEYLGRG